MSETKATAYDVITDRVVAMLEKGVCPWSKPWTTRGGFGAPVNVTGRRYSGVNVFMLASQGYGTPVWMTFNQAKAHGGSVKKGEKGTPVVYYKVIEKTKMVDGVEKIDRVFFLRYFTVFNVEQTEGVKLPKTTAAIVEAATTAPVADVQAVISAAEAIVDGYVKAPGGPAMVLGGDVACYSPSTDTIRVPQRDAFKSPASAYATMFHEMAHSTGHASRLAREGVTNFGRFGDHAYSFEELVAEMTATYLAAEAGIVEETIENSAAYLAHWVSVLKSDKQMIVRAASAAQKAANLILGVTAVAAKEEDEEKAA